MPVIKEPVQQRPFERSLISPEMESLFRYVMGLREHEPAHIDNVADVMDYELSDDDLARICGSPAGPPVSDSPAGTICYSCELRMRLFGELAEIDMSLELAEGSLACGWVIELLGDGSAEGKKVR